MSLTTVATTVLPDPILAKLPASRAERFRRSDFIAAAIVWLVTFGVYAATLAPDAQFMHPTDEHLLPWFIAAGAGGAEHAPIRLHASVAGGHLGMDAYAFGADARTLARDVEAVATAM